MVNLQFLSSNPAANTLSPSALEIDRYIAALFTPTWMQRWATNASQYPQCAALVRTKQLVPATAILSERQFSTAGRLVIKL